MIGGKYYGMTYYKKSWPTERYKGTHNYRQNNTQKTKHWATRTTQTTGVNTGAPAMKAAPAPLVASTC